LLIEKIKKKKENMTPENKRKTFKRNDFIDIIIDLRLKKGLSRTSIFEHLTKELELSSSYAYQLIREASEEFESRSVVNFGKDLAIDIERFEVLYEKAIKAGDKKEAREVLKEISKLKGHYKERLDITSGGDKLTTIINIIKPE
jgi:hypothetical protein